MSATSRATPALKVRVLRTPVHPWDLGTAGGPCQNSTRVLLEIHARSVLQEAGMIVDCIDPPLLCGASLGPDRLSL